MKKLFIPMTILLATALLLMACSDNSGNSDSKKESQATEEQDHAGENSSSDKKDIKSESEESGDDSSDETSAKENDALAEYSAAEIEYARVWLQLGENQDIDELNVEHISSGQSLNPDDETSASYPEDVIQLAGSRLADGSVIYSGNGDGTINVYDVPLRWDGENPAGEDFYNKIIENPEQVSIDPGDDQEIITLIEMLNIHD